MVMYLLTVHYNSFVIHVCLDGTSKNQLKANWDALVAQAFCENCAQET
jgi:hypothetical protein